jgi:hypothetical protein
LARARVLQARGVCVVTNGDSIGSIYKFFTVKSNDVIRQILIDNATTTAGAGNIGLYRTTADGAAVVSVSLFAAALALTANRAVDITRQSGTITEANMEKRIWELLGLSADPQLEYDVCLTLTAAATTTGAVCLSSEIIAAT